MGFIRYKHGMTANYFRSGKARSTSYFFKLQLKMAFFTRIGEENLMINVFWTHKNLTRMVSEIFILHIDIGHGYDISVFSSRIIEF